MEMQAFEQRLVEFVDGLCRRQGLAACITPQTPLFEGGLIDSRRVVDLMAFVEQELGVTIPDDRLSMEYFRTPADIAREFADSTAPPPALSPRPVFMTFGDSGGCPSPTGVATLQARGDILAERDGTVSLRGAALALHAHFRKRFAALAAEEDAEPRRYPTLLPLADLQHTDYFKSFPQHATFCACLHREAGALQPFLDDVKSGLPVSQAAAGRLEAPGVVLPSALCYHCYREYAGRTLAPGLTLLTTEGRCFRNERGAFRALDRCYEFTMREIVMLGEPAAIERRRMQLLDRVVEMAVSLGLSGTVEPATDFFFRGNVDGRARTLHQRAFALKYELRARMDADGSDLAVASFNLHEDYFGRSFGIGLPDGRAASSGCVGFGIERWVSAFVARHGADPEHWPGDVAADCGGARR